MKVTVLIDLSVANDRSISLLDMNELKHSFGCSLLMNSDKSLKKFDTLSSQIDGICFAPAAPNKKYSTYKIFSLNNLLRTLLISVP